MVETIFEKTLGNFFFFQYEKCNKYEEIKKLDLRCHMCDFKAGNATVSNKVLILKKENKYFLFSKLK